MRTASRLAAASPPSWRSLSRAASNRTRAARRPFDAGADACARRGAPTPRAGIVEVAPDASPYLGGPCVDDAQCDDGIACTYDSCDKAARPLPQRARRHPVPGRRLLRRQGAVRPGPRLRAGRGGLVRRRQRVPDRHVRRGQPSRARTRRATSTRTAIPTRTACPATTATTSTPTSRACTPRSARNGVDDNCNGMVDEQPCVAPQGDDVRSAVVLSGAGTLPGLHGRRRQDLRHLVQRRARPPPAQNVVAAITVPPGGQRRPRRVGHRAATEVAVAIDGVVRRRRDGARVRLGQRARRSVRARARSVAPGHLLHRGHHAGAASAAVLQVDFLAAVVGADERRLRQRDAPSSPARRRRSPSSTRRPTCPTACPAPDRRADVLLHPRAAAGRPRLRVDGAWQRHRRRRPARAPVHRRDRRAGVRRDRAQPLFERALPAGTYVVTVGGHGVHRREPPGRGLARRPPSPPTRRARLRRRSPRTDRSTYDLSSTTRTPSRTGASRRPGRGLRPHARERVGRAARRPLPADASGGAVSLDVARVRRRPSLARAAPTGDARSASASATCPPATIASSSPTSSASRGRSRPSYAPPSRRPSSRRGAPTPARRPSTRRAAASSRATRPPRAPTTGRGCDAPGQPAGGAPDQVLRPDPDAAAARRARHGGLDVHDDPRRPPGPRVPRHPRHERVLRRLRAAAELPRPRARRRAATGSSSTGYDGAEGAWNLDVRVLPP